MPLSLKRQNKRAASSSFGQGLATQFAHITPSSVILYHIESSKYSVSVG